MRNQPSFAYRARLYRAGAVALVLATTSVFAIGEANGATVRRFATHRADPTVVKMACDRELSEPALWDLAPFAKKYGIDPQCVEISSYDESLTAVENGSVDLGVLGIPEMATVAADHLPLKIVAGYSNGAQNIVIRNGLNVTSWTGLSGKTVCLPEGTGVAVMVEIALEQHHVSHPVISSIGFVTTTALEALKDGTCQVLGYWSPVTDDAVADGSAHYSSSLNLNTATSVGAANGVLLANSHIYKQKTLMVNFLKAYAAAVNYFNANPAKWASIAATVTGTSKALIAKAISRTALTYNVYVKGAEIVARYGPALGFTTTDASASIPGIVDLSFLSKATGKSVSQLSKAGPAPTG